MSGKELLKSKTFWGIAAAAVSLGLQIAGVSVPAESLAAVFGFAQESAADGRLTLNEIAAGVGMLLGGYGRWVASVPITRVAGFQVRQ